MEQGRKLRGGSMGCTIIFFLWQARLLSGGHISGLLVCHILNRKVYNGRQALAREKSSFDKYL
jgi:hypothetical protein